MSSATVGTAKTSYLYNGLGQRVRQVTGTLANPTGLLVYDEAGHIVGEYHSVTGKASKEFIYLGDTPVGILEQVVTGVAPTQVYGMNMYYVYVDHLNTPRVITRSPDGKMVWRWDGSDPFGLMLPNDNPAGLGVFIMNLRMPGQYFDKSTNLFYNYYRDYDPQVGRYVQSDPIGLEGGINTYSYVGANPIAQIDPDGLQIIIPGRKLFPPGFGPATGPAHAEILDYDDDRSRSQDPDAERRRESSAGLRQAEYERAKHFCDKPPLPGGNECSTLSNQIDHAEQCISFYELWDQKWLPGRHAEKLSGWRNRLQNLKKTHRKNCTQKCP